MPRARVLVSFFAFVSATILGPTSVAQIQNVTDITSTPTPGVGHDYIRMLNETVNPANGSVSLRVSVPTAPGRKLTIPFAFAYDSNGVHHFVPAGSGFLWLSNRGFLSQGGWTYTVPMMSYDTSQQVFSPDGGQTNYTCDFTTDYMFQDASGGRHALFLSRVLNDSTECGSFPSPPQSYPTGGDDFMGAALSGSLGLDLTVADADGTVYSIPWANQNEGGGNPNANTVYGLPPRIEDRNGNIALISDNHNGAFTVTDTLGRAAISSSGFGASGNTVTISGLSTPYILTWGTATTNFTPGHNILSGSPCSGPPLDGESQAVVTAITLPNGKQYQFFYDGTYGLLNKIVYPSGGYVSYVWGLSSLAEGGNFALSDSHGPYPCDFTYDMPAVLHRYVSFDGSTVALQQDFNYSTNYPSGSTIWTSKQTTVTTHDNVRGTSWQTVYNYSSTYSVPAPNTGFVDSNQIPVEQTIVYKDTNGSTLRTMTKAWFDPYLLGCELSTLDNGLITGRWNTYGTLGQLTDKKEYDYGLITSASTCQSNSGTVPPPSGITPTRETAISYQSFPNSPIFPGPTLFDRPSNVKTYGSGTLAAETDYSYDQTGPSSVGSLPTGTHDSAYAYNASPQPPRGNATAVIEQCFNGPCVGGNPKTTYTYYETGQALSRTDACGNTACSDMTGSTHTTTYSYADNFDINPSSSTNAYLTQITNPLGQISTFKYAYLDGQLISSTDPNRQAASYLYNDSLRRLTETDYPDGGKTTLSYNDTAPSPTVTTSRLITSSPSLSLTTVALMDGLGHVTQAQLTSDPDGATYTDTKYDGLGRTYCGSNPYRTSNPQSLGNFGSTDGITTTVYDALGRVTVVQPPDYWTSTSPGGPTCPSVTPQTTGQNATNFVSTSYSGNCTTVTDQTGKSRKSCSDALGRLTQVFEDPAGLNYETDYAYDALNNLLTVNQKGGTTDSSQWRPRTFAYDSLSRLTSATNPESGTTTYSYDANGNLASKISPAPNQTSTATVTANYLYDALNRLTQKSFSDGTTPMIKYGYDAVALTGCAVAPPSLSDANPIGRRTAMCDGAGAESWSHDSMGRPLTDQRTTNNVGKTTSYTYNLDGSLNNLTYPDPATTITYTQGAAGRLLSGTIPAVFGMSYNAHYAPNGSLCSLLACPPAPRTRSYDTRNS